MNQDNQNKTRKRLLNPIPAVPGEIGKLPPQAVELEEAVLGAMLLEREALSTVIDILSKEAFYKEQNGRVYAAMVALFNRSEPVDILTVTQELKRSGELELVGGAYYVSALTNRIASAANIEFHARIVAQKYLQRELIRLSTETIKFAYEDSTDVFELLDETTKNIFEILDSNVRKQHDKMSTLIAKALVEIEVASNQKEGLLGVPSGFTSLDRITGGWQKSDLLILAARPGMGKTAFVVSMAKNAAVEFNKPVAIFSLEMSSLQLVKRLISSETEIAQDKILKGNLDNHEFVQLNERIKKLSVAPLYIDDTPALSVFELRAKARRLKENQKVELIIIDYLQLMSGGADAKGNREQEISHISRNLKSLSKELEIPIIALSQLSRQVENRPGGSKRPQLSDLRESGAIEQDADMVMFIYRPEYYGMEVDENNEPTRGKAELIIAKNRHGALDTVKLRFIGQYAKFADLDYSEGQDLIYSQNTAGGLQQNEDFLGAGTKTVISKNWDREDDINSEIIKRNDIEDLNEPPF
ncbi:MAG: replicative DNA helicase [Bacteroidia bacterium]|jgi:replicative DNA helicase|nr:replicative DNA helicase [Bacteroidia bacterium]